MTSKMRMQNKIPLEVREAYFGKGDFAITPLDGGATNTTYLLIYKSKAYILQRLHHIFTEATVLDFHNVSQYLREQNWETQQLLPTIRGTYVYTDSDGHVWRVSSYLEGEDASVIALDHTTLVSIGSLLAKLHIDLATCSYLPTFRIDKFHETEYYSHSLAQKQSYLPTHDVRIFAREVLHAYQSHPSLPLMPNQLIHGDPRTNNILFRNGKPFTYIDFDTVMIGNIWVDIGDLLRALCGDVTQTIQQFSHEKVAATIDGYYRVENHSLSKDAFLTYSLLSLQQICLELTMRFLIDLVDDSYFSWDAKRFASRQANNLARAQTQWEIYKRSLS